MALGATREVVDQKPLEFMLAALSFLLGFVLGFLLD